MHDEEVVLSSGGVARVQERGTESAVEVNWVIPTRHPYRGGVSIALSVGDEGILSSGCVVSVQDCKSAERRVRKR